MRDLLAKRVEEFLRWFWLTNTGATDTNAALKSGDEPTAILATTLVTCGILLGLMLAEPWFASQIPPQYMGWLAFIVWCALLICGQLVYTWHQHDDLGDNIIFPTLLGGLFGLPSGYLLWAYMVP